MASTKKLKAISYHKTLPSNTDSMLPMDRNKQEGNDPPGTEIKKDLPTPNFFNGNFTSRAREGERVAEGS